LNTAKKEKVENKGDDPLFAENIEDIENKKPKTKRFKTEEIKVDIDSMLTGYSSTNTEQAFVETQQNESSTYFVSKSEYSSPVLTKSNKKRAKSPQSAKRAHSSYFSFNLEDDNEKTYSSPVVGNDKSQIKEETVFSKIEREIESASSPQIIKKTNTIHDTASIRKDLANFFDSFTLNKNSQSSQESQKNANNDCEETVLVQQTETAKKPLIEKPQALSNSKSSKKPAKGKQAEAACTKPISDFFTKFEFSKPTVNKLNA